MSSSPCRPVSCRALVGQLQPKSPVTDCAPSPCHLESCLRHSQLGSSHLWCRICTMLTQATWVPGRGWSLPVLRCCLSGVYGPLSQILLDCQRRILITSMRQRYLPESSQLTSWPSQHRMRLEQLAIDFLMLDFQ